MVSGIPEEELSFIAQLLPIERGILETVYFRAPRIESAEDLLGVYTTRYRGEAFIRLYQCGTLPDLRGVQHTNFCDIGVRFHPPSGRAVVVCAIDNLGKGAAGHALQNMNLALGLAETEGLL